ncbi:hypothetical protein BOX15_Mlig001607g1 [Macrostomum lignano]|uniref:Uncharacterized protein n=1 Tax=Macrostomum lignano TaxID=282301 RepID=A0A267FEY4_9PLAT|nr:hypothetical protein BOX15_Mlig001607g1 [Macrostomum lignano]
MSSTAHIENVFDDKYLLLLLMCCEPDLDDPTIILNYLIFVHTYIDANGRLLRSKLSALQQLNASMRSRDKDAQVEHELPLPSCRDLPDSKLAELSASAERIASSVEELSLVCADFEEQIEHHNIESHARLSLAESSAAQAAAEAAKLRRESASRALESAAAETSRLRSQRKMQETSTQLIAARSVTKLRRYQVECKDLEERLNITNASLAKWRRRLDSHRQAHASKVAAMSEDHSHRMATYRKQISEAQKLPLASGQFFIAMKTRFELITRLMEHRFEFYCDQLSKLRHLLNTRRAKRLDQEQAFRSNMHTNPTAHARTSSFGSATNSAQLHFTSWGI